MNSTEHTAATGITHFHSSGLECRSVNTFVTSAERCRFVTESPNCAISEGWLHYSAFIYCTLGDLIPLGVALQVLWWIIVFVSLLTTADDYFCPAVVVIVKTLKLSPNIAGVTFLAFGNGAPDLFSAIAAFGSMKGEDAGLAVGGLFGAGMFVTTIIAGTISILRPFKANERPFLRDDIFYMAGCYWTFYILWRGKMYLWEAIGYILLYVCYVLVVIVSGTVHRQLRARERSKRRRLQRSAPTRSHSSVGVNPSEGPSTDETQFSTEHTQMRLQRQPTMNSVRCRMRLMSLSNEEAQRVLEECPTEVEIIDDASSDSLVFDPDLFDEEVEKLGDIKARREARALAQQNEVLENGPEESATAQEPESAPLSPLKEFLYAMNPIDLYNWPRMSVLRKALEVVKESLGWNRHLNCLQLLLSPIFSVLIIKVGFIRLAGVVPVYAIVIPLTLLGSILTFVFTKNDKTPRFFEGFGYIGFVVAMVWIYVIATELVNLLTCFGIVLNLSNAILGVTLLAWGNCMADFAADLAMTRQGFPRMAFSACFGAPIFHLQLSTGLALTIRMLQRGETEVPMALNVQILSLNSFVLGSLVLSLILLPFLKFKADKRYGVILLAYYLVFLAVMLLAEVGLLPENIPGRYV